MGVAWVSGIWKVPPGDSNLQWSLGTTEVGDIVTVVTILQYMSMKSTCYTPSAYTVLMIPSIKPEKKKEMLWEVTINVEARGKR